MATRKPQKPRIGRPPGSGVKGHVPVLIAMRQDPREALVAVAEKRREPGARLPVSEVVRDILDAALGTKPPPPKIRRK